MAKLRKFCAYRRLERPYTRISKYRKKSFIRVRPHSKIVKFNMGDASVNFPKGFDLIVKADLQIRHNALESGRLSCNRFLEKNLGKKGFKFEIRAFPHHILRENPLASGAGADRMSTGMKMSFGKPIGVAAQLRIGSPVFTVYVPAGKEKIGREALKRASKKLPCSCQVIDHIDKAAKSAPRAGKVSTPKPSVAPAAKSNVVQVSEESTGTEANAEPKEKEAPENKPAAESADKTEEKIAA